MKSAVRATSQLGDESQSWAERRAEPDSGLRERRVIPRLGDARIRFYAQQIHRLCRVWIGASVLYVIAMVGAHFAQNMKFNERSLFFGLVVTVVAIAVHGVSMAARSYMENESEARIAKFMERCFVMFLVMVVISAVLGVAHLITLF